MSFVRRHWQLMVLGALAVGVGLYFLTGADLPLPEFTRENISAMVERAGLWGPVLIVGLMIVAVVASPLPSAPIALAAGAAYGHFEGTILVLLGSEAGAMIAFGLARILGRETLQRMLGTRIDAGLLGSQNVLMLGVFASRLMPFISFDMVSYAAGLSALTFWRFAVATMAGIIPASFVLAHLGGQVVEDPYGVGTILVLGLGLVTGAPLLLMLFRKSDRGASGESAKATHNMTQQEKGKDP